MEETEKPEEEVPVYKDRSLLYMGIGLGLLILIMGYLTLFVDDPWKIFRKDEVPEKVLDEGNSSILNKSESMSDEEVRASLVKFIEAFYYDQRKGYFDPPSYFAKITVTFYNYHNLNYQRLKDIYWKRLADMHNFSRNWVVSSLDFERKDSKIIASYWTKESYFKPSVREQYSADIKYEMIIDEEGKIESLRDIEVRNEVVNKVAPDSALLNTELIEASPAVVSQDADSKVYDMNLVESAPEFNGGQRELNKYISNNIKYPAAARQNNIQGKVYLSFIVEKDGSINDIKVKQGIGSGCDEEAIRVLRSSPKWKPGMIKGSAVRTYCILPVTFQLE
ncbi:energy transducer TonB [Arcticibacter tournemirensis]